MRAGTSWALSVYRTVIANPRSNSTGITMNRPNQRRSRVTDSTVYATSTLRMALTAMALLWVCGALGMWTDTLDTLALTIAAVLLSLAIGIGATTALFTAVNGLMLQTIPVKAPHEL